MARKRTSQPTVERRSVKASFFIPSKYSVIGLYKTKSPVTVAEMTNSMSMNTGIIYGAISSGLLPKILSALAIPATRSDI